MRRFLHAVLPLLCLPVAVQAAELTRIASSFEEKDPFGMFLDVGFERTQNRLKIVRENHQNGDVQDATELRYVGTDTRLNVDVRFGLWKDVEFKYKLPVVFQQNRRWAYSQGETPTDDSNSTIANNCVQPNGDLTDPACPATGAGARAIFAVPQESYRSGLGDMTFGLAWAPFNQQKDPTKPTWIIGFDYTAPTADQLDPAQATAPDARGRLGDRVHKYKLYTSFSKRVGPADPYFHLGYTAPFRGPGWYSNCDHPDATRMSFPENCGVGPWTRENTGIDPPHVGDIIVGTELIPYEDKAKGQRVGLDLRAITKYVSQGRYYNELSDPLGKLLLTSDYLELGGRIGFFAHAAEYVRLNLSAELLFQTDRTLTNESIGEDANGNGRVDVATDTREINPSFDYRYDMVSRRFRGEGGDVFRINASAVFTF